MRNRLQWENVREFCEGQNIARCEMELKFLNALALRYNRICENLQSYIDARRAVEKFVALLEKREKRKKDKPSQRTSFVDRGHGLWLKYGNHFVSDRDVVYNGHANLFIGGTYYGRKADRKRTQSSSEANREVGETIFEA